MVAKALSKRREDRYGSAGELARAAREAITVSPTVLTAAPLPRRPSGADPGWRLQRPGQPFPHALGHIASVCVGTTLPRPEVSASTGPSPPSNSPRTRRSGWCR